MNLEKAKKIFTQLKQQDWTYEYSDDISEWNKGYYSFKLVAGMIAHSAKSDSDRLLIKEMLCVLNVPQAKRRQLLPEAKHV